ncbi:unnamed protein product, partial [Phyllotreta striolata]
RKIRREGSCQTIYAYHTVGITYVFIIVVISGLLLISLRCNMWVRGFIVGVIISSIFQLASSKPFLHNALLTLASSASASSSSPSAKLTNIADYTKKQEKVQELENEKRLTNTDIVNPIDSDEQTNNEATPSLIRKQLNKFLAKIQFLSTLSASQAPMDVEETAEGATATPKSEVKIEFDGPGEHIQRLTGSRKEYGIPLRINLEINEVAGNSTEAAEDAVEAAGSAEEAARVGQLGVFFAELFGSLVGLVYGAIAHINNAAQGNGELETTL